MLNSFTFILTLCIVAAYNEDYYKVGTVLFNKDSLNKQRWPLHDLLVLQARLQFLKVIPPPQMLNMQDKNFANSILTYFKDSIQTIKAEVPDPEMRGILVTALSDIIGGYMKMWVLPIVKYAYYGGTVPQDDALEIFDFHDELKKFLQTDGSGWQGPNSDFLNTIAINITPISVKSTYNNRRSPVGCEALAYYEKTSSGLAIPMPNINWNTDSESMFIPLRNGTLVSLNSRKDSDSLLNYYQTARTCVSASQIDDKLFEDRLQSWLTQDILPHLNDDKLYPALKSVLLLVNRTRSLCDTVIDLYSMNKASQGLHKVRSHIAGLIPIDLSSKKMMVITIIIFLEIVWCIPTLCYLMYTKLRNRNKGYYKSNVYYFIDPKQPNKMASGTTKCSIMSDITQSKETQKIITSNKGLTAKHSTRSACFGCPLHNNLQHVKLLTQQKAGSNHSIGTGTRSNFTCQLNRLEVATTRRQTCNQVPSKRAISSLKNIPHEDQNDQKVNKTQSTISQITDLNSGAQDKNTSKTASFITVQELQPTKTVTLLRDNLARAKLGNVEFVNEMCSVDSRNPEIVKKESTQSTKQPSTSRKKRHGEVHSAKANKVAAKERSSVTTRTASTPHTQLEDKPKKSKKSTGPVVEITIDNPTDICVDIGGVRVQRPSKIPKRNFNSHVTQTSWVRAKKCRPGKTGIPHLKRQMTLDDMAVKSKKTAEKLNDTL